MLICNLIWKVWHGRSSLRGILACYWVNIAPISLDATSCARYFYYTYFINIDLMQNLAHT